MNADKLVRMANEIAAFFRAYPEEQARAGIRDHIMAFWTPAMRAALRADTSMPAAGLDPLVLAALRAPARPESPVAKETASATVAGQLASDAG